jgi:phage virion morphogenesis protein
MERAIMTDRLNVRVTGGASIEARLHQVSERLKNRKALMQQIGMQLESSTEDNFKGGHDPYGVPWPKSLRAKMTGGKTLMDTRRLAGSIGSVASNTSVEVGTNVVYAARHNQGSRGEEKVARHRRVLTTVFGIKLTEPKTVDVKAFTRKAKTPKRQFLGVGKHDEGDILALIENYLDVGD